MSITFQQLRSAVPGAMPAQLDVGQLAFNVSDGTMYLGTGGNTRIEFSGEVALPNPPAGKGWIQFLLDRDALNDYFVANPIAEGAPAPLNEQVLTWNTTTARAEWQNAGTGEAYFTTNTNVSVAPGINVSQKITSAIGSPAYIGNNASCVVDGAPGSQYQGLYIYNGTEWKFAAQFAFPTAFQVPGTNPMTLAVSNVQAILDALKAVDDSLQAQIDASDSDITTLQAEMAQAQTDINDLNANKLNVATNIPTAGQILSFNGAGQLWVDQSAGDVTTVSGTLPITVNNGDPGNPVVGVNNATNATTGVVRVGTNVQLAAGLISINDASTTQKGVVELVDTLNSTSTTQALTARAGADLQQQINDLAAVSNLVLAGGYDAATGVMQSVTSDGAAQSFVVGNPLPAPAAGNNDYYVIVVVAGSNPEACNNGDWFLSDGSAWLHLAVGPVQQPASYTQQGIVQLADSASVYAGTSDNLAITPASLYANMSDSVTTADSHIIASATAVKTAADAAAAAQATADAAIPDSTFTSAGELLYGTGAGTYNVLPAGDSGQVLKSNGVAPPSWADLALAVYSSTKSLTAGVPVRLLRWDNGPRIGTLFAAGTDGAGGYAWANVTIAADNGVGSSVATTSTGTNGVLSVVAAGTATEIVFLPSVSIPSADFYFQYIASVGDQPTVL